MPIRGALLYYFAGCTDSLEAHALQFSNLGVEAEALLATPQIKGESNGFADYTTDLFEDIFVAQVSIKERIPAYIEMYIL